MKDMQLEYKSDKDTTMLAVEGEQPKYPYGLRLHLNAESLKKLGLTPELLPQVGNELTLHAKVQVAETGVSESANNQEPNADMTLQITAMELSGAQKADAAQRLFGGSAS